MGRTCKACGAQVLEEATRCPACGAEPVKSMKVLPLAAFMLIVILVAQAYIAKSEKPAADSAPPAKAAER
ncbi:hypothetical protein HP532_13765 [Pseudomonas sp. CrR25]|nr:hypothetical protein [Pseudomonas sp. CrR25]